MTGKGQRPFLYLASTTRSQRCQQDPEFFDTAEADHQQQLAQEIAKLEQEAQRLAEEIENLTGVAPEGD